MAEPMKPRDSWEAILADAERCYVDNSEVLATIKQKKFCKMGEALFKLWQENKDEDAHALYKRLQAIPFLYEKDDTFFMMMQRKF